MSSLFAIEWLKIKSYRTFWVLMLLFALILLLWGLGTNSGFLKVGGPGVNLLGAATAFSGIWVSLTNYASYLVLVPAIFMIISVTNEYQFRTSRQHVIDGWTRLKWYHAKWLLLLILAAVTTAFTFLLGVCLGLVLGVPFGGIGEEIGRIGYLFVLSVNYFGFSFLLSILLRRSGLTIGLLFLYCMLELMLYLLFFFKLEQRGLNALLPLQSSDELLPSASFRMAMTLGKIKSANVSDWVFVAGSLGWIVAYYLIGRRILLRRDW